MSRKIAYVFSHPRTTPVVEPAGGRAGVFLPAAAAVLGMYRESDPDQINYVVSEAELFEVYDSLAKATQAAAMGNPNECASKAADAKDKLESVHEDGELLHEVNDA